MRRFAAPSTGQLSIVGRARTGDFPTLILDRLLERAPGLGVLPFRDEKGDSGLLRPMLRPRDRDYEFVEVAAHPHSRKRFRTVRKTITQLPPINPPGNSTAATSAHGNQREAAFTSFTAELLRMCRPY